MEDHGVRAAIVALMVDVYGTIKGPRPWNCVGKSPFGLRFVWVSIYLEHVNHWRVGKNYNQIVKSLWGLIGTLQKSHTYYIECVAVF